MDQKSRELLAVALTLPEKDRATIAEALLQTLPPEPGAGNDDQFASELDRRLEEGLRDPTATVPWTELKNPR